MSTSLTVESEPKYELGPFQIMQWAKEQGLTGADLNSYLDFGERMRRISNEQAWNEAMHRCQSRMGPIRAAAWNPQTKSRYARFEQLDQALRPIYTEEGFCLSFGPKDSSTSDLLWVGCDVIHVAGFTKSYQYPIPISTKGPKGQDFMMSSHAAGSAGSYGQRYLEGMIFNIPIIKDDDGNKAGGSTATPMEERDFALWMEKIEGANSEEALKTAFLGAREAALKMGDQSAVQAFTKAKNATYRANGGWM